MSLKINHTRNILKYHLNLWMIVAFIFAIGTLAPFCLEFIKIGFQSSLSSRLDTLLGSDLVISSRLVLPIKSIDKFKEADSETLLVKSLYTMTKKEPVSGKAEKVKSRLAQLTFVPKGFPFYGSLIPEEHKDTFFKEKVVLVWPELLELLGLKVSDSLIIGKHAFKIIGLIQNDPGQVTQGQALAPRIYLGHQHAQGIGLIAKGSTVSYAYHFKFKDKAQQKRVEPFLKENFDKEGINVRNSQENGEFIGRTVGIINNFLGLGSFLSLVLSMLAISFVLNKMFKRESSNLLIYRQMGVPFKWVFLKYLKAFGVVSFIASLSSAIFGYLIAPAIAGILKEKFNLEIDSPSWIYIPGFVSVSLVSLIVFFTPISLQYLRNSFREVIQLKWIRAGYILTALWVTAIAFFWTSSWKLLLVTLIGLLVLALLVSGFGYIFFQVIERLISSQKYPVLKLGILQMTRYRVHSLITLFLLTSSIGIFGLINSVADGLQYGLNFDAGTKRPSMFMFDIQPEQIDEFHSLINEHGGKVRKLAPMVRARLIKIDGNELTIDKNAVKTQENDRKERFLKRGVNLSYQDRLFESEEILEGVNFFDKSYQAKDEEEISISVEKGYADLLDLELGSKMTFEVLGVELEGIVRNIRKINWQSFDPNFFLVVSPGHLEEAPQTLVASVNLPPKSIAKFQNKLFEDLPNISSLDVRRVFGRIVGIISKVRGIFKIYGIFIIILGVVIIFGLLHLHWEDRLKDMSFFQLLGISQGDVNKMMSFELFNLFLISLIFSLCFQVGLSQVILDKIFDMDVIQYEGVLVTTVISLSIFLSLLGLYYLRSQQRSRRAFQKDA